jgi:hypothetical protein
MKKDYEAPHVSDLGEVAELTQGNANNNGFDSNASMGEMTGS